MNINLKGKIKDIFPVEIYGSFEKRVFWLEETEGKYPNTYQLECHHDFGNDLDKYNKDEEVICSVDIRGRHWTKNGKEGVINTLKCWKIEKVYGK